MSEYTYWRSRTLVKRGQVKLEESCKGYMRFVVNGHEVFRTGDGEWSCNAATFDKKKKEKVGCVLFGNRDKFCSHILACKHWLKGEDLK